MSDAHIRTASFQLRDGTEDGLTLEGHAAVFNQRTEIRDWLGSYDEQIAPGAFVRTLRARTPVLMFDHGTHPLVGEMPLGSLVDVREDDVGLFVSARLHDNWLVEPVRDAVRSGSISGMSFQFSVPSGGDEWVEPEDRADGGSERLRIIREVKLYEMGPVVFPAYPTTDVLVRNAPKFGVPVAEELLDPVEMIDEPEGFSPGQRAALIRSWQLA